jgi:sulfur carrier protein ThiS
MQLSGGKNQDSRPADSGTIELRAFMFLWDLFKERCWSNPKLVPLEGETTGVELLASLTVPREKVAAVFVNHKLFLPENAIIHPGDRVSLVPPGGLVFPELGCRKCTVI